jgi:transcriptional regulator with XRE-family HTH domain
MGPCHHHDPLTDVTRLIMRRKRTPVADATDQHVGSRVRMRRLMLGLSQGKIADALGVTFQQVQKYENGKNRIAASRLQQLSRMLQVPIEFFFEGAPRVQMSAGKTQAATIPDYVSAFLITSDGLALVKAFTGIKRPALRTRIVKLVEEMADAAD